MIKISNLLNCNLRDFLIIVFSIGIALGSSIFMDTPNFNFPVLRQILGFVYLTFIPGIVLLRLFKLKIKLPEIEIFLYTVGLSVTFTMFLGFLLSKSTWLNFKPLSTLPFIYISFTILFILCILCYFNEKGDKRDPLIVNFKYLLSPAFLFLSLIPLTAIIGAYLLNFYHSNILLILFILLVTLTVFLVVYGNYIPKNLYPFAIFVIAISILYHNSLSSTYLEGYDIQNEYYFANLVKLSGIWDPSINTNLNAMLSVVILAPIYSEVCNLELTWVFKIIYPFLFSLVPLGIYHIYNRQINNETISFLSVFYFISIITYFTEMLSLARQEIAELFLILITMLMISDLKLSRRRLLLVIFSLALVTSHYGLSYLILLFSIPGYLFMAYALKRKSDTFRFNVILIIFVSIFLWYSLITDGSIFETIVHLFSSMKSTFIEDFFNSRAVSIATSKSYSLSDQILKITYLISQFFIIAGFIKVYLNKNQLRFSSEFLAFSFMFLLTLIASAMTNLTGMNIHRLYHVASLFLSLFFVIGILSLLQLLGGLCKIKTTNLQSSKLVKQLSQSKYPVEFLGKNLKLVTGFLIIFMLFNIGIPQEILKDHPTSHSLNRELILGSGDNKQKSDFYSLYFPEQDVIGTKWLAHRRSTNLDIYADSTSTNLLFHSYGMMPSEKILTNKIKGDNLYYIYLRYPVVHYGIIKGSLKLGNISHILSQKNLIYSSKDNLIYL